MSNEAELLAPEAQASCNLDPLEWDQEPSGHCDPSILYTV
jgi:hypothetical protein